jgi:predicted nucleic acid-binding protein
VRVLLDTCVLSELRRPKPDPGVQSAIAALSREDLFVSVLSLGEIAKGIALLKDGRNKSALQSWLQTMEWAARARSRSIPVWTESGFTG